MRLSYWESVFFFLVVYFNTAGASRNDPNKFPVLTPWSLGESMSNADDPSDADLASIRAKKMSYATCSSDVGLLHIVLRGAEESLIIDGEPQTLPVKELTSLRSCQRWEGTPICCSADFLKQVDQLWDLEATRMAQVRDVYAHAMSDVMAPALSALEGERLFTDILNFSRHVLEEQLQRHVLNYIDECEDPLRLFFGAMTCELCDPQLQYYLGDRKFMRARKDTCQELWNGCHTAPSDLAAVAKLLREVGEKLEATINAGMKDPKVTFAHTWMVNAAARLSETSQRIDFYEDQTIFCDAVAREGYVYRPCSWGHLDLLHPFAAEHQDHGLDDSSKICEHGQKTLHTSKHAEKECKCNACWTGSQCDVPVQPGPFKTQVFKPLVAQGMEQPFHLGGCELPQDMDSQFAHIKIVRSTRSLASEGLSVSEDACDRAPDKHFLEVPHMVPVVASGHVLEWSIYVPVQSEQAYSVCYCYGVGCLTNGSSWHETGHLQIVPSENIAKAIEIKLEQEEQELENDALQNAVIHTKSSDVHLDAIPDFLATRPCDHQWASGLMTGVRYKEIDHNVEFECSESFGHLEGPSELNCVDGVWFEKVPIRKLWDRKLPFCKWNYSHCNEGLVHPERGMLVVENGVAKYSCLEGNKLMVQTKEEKVFVRFCQPSGTWEPDIEPLCVPENTGVELSSSSASFFQMSSVEGHGHKSPDPLINAPLKIYRWPVDFDKDDEDNVGIKSGWIESCRDNVTNEPESSETVCKDDDTVRAKCVANNKVESVQQETLTVEMKNIGMSASSVLGDLINYVWDMDLTVLIFAATILFCAGMGALSVGALQRSSGSSNEEEEDEAASMTALGPNQEVQSAAGPSRNIAPRPNQEANITAAPVATLRPNQEWQGVAVPVTMSGPAASRTSASARASLAKRSSLAATRRSLSAAEDATAEGVATQEYGAWSNLEAQGVAGPETAPWLYQEAGGVAAPETAAWPYQNAEGVAAAQESHVWPNQEAEAWSYQNAEGVAAAQQSDVWPNQ